MSPLVSILIPAFNAQEWIADTIESALAQTWPQKEIIIIDDGSTDDTLAIARRYAGMHVLVVSQENQGAAATRNVAFSRCQGAYIQWLDADDLLAPDKVERQMQLREPSDDSRFVMSCPWANFMYRPRAARFAPTVLWGDSSPVDWIVRKWNNNAHMQTATWLVSRELTEAAGPWNTQLLGDDDGEYFTRVVLASHGVRFTADARVYYRVVGANRLSHIGQSKRKLEAQLAGMKLQIGYVRAHDDGPRVHAAIVTYLQTWLPYFYPEHPDLVDEMRILASDVGGELKPPPVSWKYALIDKLFDRSTAKQAQLRYNTSKTSVLRSFDRLLYALIGG
jgi:glycosyltransferase involved in cell wall biosynthesis